MSYNFLVVGAGFAGSVAARQLAEYGFSVLVIDARNHIGGNAYDCEDEHGVLTHKYGPHIFHTGSKFVFDWLSRYTDWREYEHRVKAFVAGQYLPFPINLTTLRLLHAYNYTSAEMKEFIDSKRLKNLDIVSSQDLVLSTVGKDLCELFYSNYTMKQWGLALSELSPGVAARIPLRFNEDDRYFTDQFQFMPKNGYTSLFNNILDHHLIDVRLGVRFEELKGSVVYSHTIYTGSVDEYFGYCFGKLPYRSLYFEHYHIPNMEYLQNVGTINYPNDHDYTRITEFKYLTGQICAGTSLVKEYPRGEGEPYYPIPTTENQSRYAQYAAKAKARKDVTFIGRLAEYKYYNMDQVVMSSLNAVRSLLNA